MESFQPLALDCKPQMRHISLFNNRGRPFLLLVDGIRERHGSITDYGGLRCPGSKQGTVG